ncbi:hypothetical protein [Winogradskyella sp.]|uniref:hypothetical protein n=1 Tax=Winogradskyella sp. TaxID=1883156 RepID=UPI0035C878C6
MIIVIHGTKGGRQIFFPKNNNISGLFDINSDSPKGSAIGQQTYAIRSFDNNIIYSKYKIIRDVSGDKRTGFIGFSLFLPHDESLTSKDIITLLDTISKQYSDLYLENNNLEQVVESWDFLQEINRQYQPKIRKNSFSMGTIKSGDKDDAIIYYRDSLDLQKSWDKGFMQHYSPYRQILYVSEKLRGDVSNPLHAIRNSGIKISIDKTSSKTAYIPPVTSEQKPIQSKPESKIKTIHLIILGVFVVCAITLLFFLLRGNTPPPPSPPPPPPVEEVKEDEKVDEDLVEVVEVVEDDKIDGVGDTPPVIVKKPPVITPPKSPPNENIEKLKGNQITKKELKELAKTSDLKISVELYLEFFKKSIENQQASYEILYNKIRKDKILKDSKLKTYLGKVSMSGEIAQRLRTTIAGEKVNRLKTLKEFENIINKD